MKVRRFTPDDAPAIERLNTRFAAAGLPHRVGLERPRGREEPSLDQEPIIERLYVAADGDEIRGAVWLKEQLFWSGGRAVRAGWPKYPVAESLIDGAAVGVPAALLFSLLRQQPSLIALGLGGHPGPFAKVLRAARWAGGTVPFFFSLLHPSRVLRHLAYARTTLARRMLADALGYSGLAWLANAVLGAARAALRPRTAPGYTGSLVDRFDGWADELWEQCRDSCGFIAVRDSRVLNALYPTGLKALGRLRVRHGGRDVGWICAQSFNTVGNRLERHFGELRLGILTDCLALPGAASGVMEAGWRYLVDQGVDLIVTYQSHPAWCAAAIDAGLWRGPSNCAVYRSPAVERLIAGAPPQNRCYHLTRSDGHGPDPV